MRSLFLFVSIFCIVFTTTAQQNHFVYLQTDNRQPFYVKLNEKVFSSSASGYLVIPKLQNGTHNLSVGFPKNEWPHQVIAVPVANKDQGFMLKNFDSKGWGLFNMQTMDVIMANSNLKPSENSQSTTRTDEFSNTLADVVNTPSIKEIKKEEVKREAVKVQDPPKTVESKATETITNIPAPLVGTMVVETANNAPVRSVVESKTSEPAVNTITANTSVPSDSGSAGSVRRINELKTAEGIVLKYVVQDESTLDTVQVIILQEEVVVNKEETRETTKEAKPADSTLPKETKPVEGKDPKFIDIELANPNAGPDSTNQQELKVEEKATSKEKAVNSDAGTEIGTTSTGAAVELKMINSDCKAFATEDDFLKIRKKMIAQKGDNEMISSAQKLFKQKCYSTEQVKNLSVLFLKDDSKYKFFDVAYPFVHDTPNFKNLESQLTDPYFISRFRAMIRN